MFMWYFVVFELEFDYVYGLEKLEVVRSGEQLFDYVRFKFLLCGLYLSSFFLVFLDIMVNCEKLLVWMYKFMK